MAARYLLAGLAVAARLVDAQCSVAGTTTISSQAQATALASCSTFKGTIEISPKTAEDISISGIGHIAGSLIAANVNKDFTSLTMENLAVIDDIFGLSNITGLATLSFPALSEVGAIDWTGLAVLSTLDFTKTVQKASVLAIQDTGLSSLTGIDLMNVNFLKITNNRFLTTVDMKLKNVTTGATIAANGLDTKVSFPDLTWAYNMTLWNVSSLSLPKLQAVNESIGFHSNFFSTLSVPNLQSISGSLSIVSNSHLSSASFPSLKGVKGGIAIANNSQLTDVDGFPQLLVVGGAIDMFGTFKNVEFPKITLVQGAFYLLSSNSLGNTCSKFQKISGPNLKIEGQFYCKDKIASASSKTGSGNSGSSSGGSSGATSLLIPYATGIIGIVAAIFGML